MSDTAQNKDEVGAILEKIIPCQDCGGYVSDHDGVQGDCNYDAGTKIVDEATKAIDDFYRNKILEARKDSLKKLVSDMDEMGRLTQYKQIRTHTIKCIDDITAQFNSRGSDAQYN